MERLASVDELAELRNILASNGANGRPCLCICAGTGAAANVGRGACA